MVIIKNTPIIKEYILNKDEKDDKKKIIKNVKKNKKEYKKIAKPLYKNIPKYSTFYKILKYNENINKKLKKKEPLKFVKINTKTNTLFKNDTEKIKYKLQDEKNKYVLKIIHKIADQEIILEEEFKKTNNKYKIKYDIKVYILDYLRSTVEDN